MVNPRDLDKEFDELLERLREVNWQFDELDEDDLEEFEIEPYDDEDQ